MIFKKKNNSHLRGWKYIWHSYMKNWLLTRHEISKVAHRCAGHCWEQWYSGSIYNNGSCFVFHMFNV